MFPRFEARSRENIQSWRADAERDADTFFTDESWLPVDSDVAIWLLKEMSSLPLTEEEIDQAMFVMAEVIEKYEHFEDRLAACQEVQQLVNRFLYTNTPVLSEEGQPLYEYPTDTLDIHLSGLAYYAGQSRNPKAMVEYLTKSLSAGARKQVEDIFQELNRQMRIHLNVEAPVTDTILPNQREVLVAETVLRGLVTFGMWKAIEVSKESAKVAKAEHKKRAVVGSVALDKEGRVLATAYRGEDANPSKHSEQVLLEKLTKEGLIDQTFIVCVNLEPCMHRSEKHAARGFCKSCSELLVEAGIPIVGYILTDDNPKNKGRGSERLDEHGIMVFTADDPAARALASSLQVLTHLKVAAIA